MVCSKCSLNKDNAEFSKGKRQCKACVREYNKRYHQNNKEKSNKRSKEWRKKNPEKVKENYHKWSRENKDYLKERDYVRYWSNPEATRERVRKYIKENPEKVKERYRKWYKANPDKWRAKYHRRRARKLLLPDEISGEQLNETLENFNGGCALTGDTSVFHWDHVIPLATETVGTVYGNMVPLRADLNMSKGSLNIFDWFTSNKERFSLSQNNFDRLIDWLAKVNGMTIDEYRDFVYECHEVKNARKTS